MQQRGAISLSVNLLVVIIISLVILVAGISFLYQLIGGAEEIKSELDARTEAELERLLIDQGKKVALPSHAVTLNAGESHVFGLGLLNIEESLYGNEFSIEVELSRAVDEKEKAIALDPLTAKKWLLYNQEKLTIRENQHHSEPILIKIPKDAPKGTYIFNVKVYASRQEQYDSTKKLLITVN